MYSATTAGIEVSVTPRFMPEESSPKEGRFFWAYTVEIVNRGEVAVRLRRRHWLITDGRGRQQDVRGPGVVGEEPVIEAGSSFRYTSGCPLETPDGTMAGTYEMEGPTGRRFPVEIPAFPLDSPHVKRVLN